MAFTWAPAPAHGGQVGTDKSASRRWWTATRRRVVR